MTTRVRPRPRSAAAMPARSSDDLPEPGRPDQGEHELRAKMLEAGGHVGVPAEEPLGVARRRTAMRPSHGHAVGTGRAGSGTSSEGSCRRIDCSSATTSGPGRCPAVGQDRLELPDRAQRLALLPGVVLRQGQQHPAAFTQRGGADQDLRSGQDLAVPPGSQRASSRSSWASRRSSDRRAGLAARGLPLSRSAKASPRHRASASLQQVRRPVGLAEREELAGPGDLLLEPAGVDLVEGQGEA